MLFLANAKINKQIFLGVLWLHDKLFDGTNTVINRFVSMGKKVYLITNNNQTTREEMVDKCKQMNFDLGLESMISSSHATALYMKQIGFDKKAYVMGPKALDKELQAVGIQTTGVGPDIIENPLAVHVMKELKLMDKEVGAVVVAFDEHLSFPKLFKAVNYLRNPDVLFIATNADEKIDFPTFTFPDAGPIIAAIQNATGRKATVVGKPSKVLAEIVLKQESHIETNRFLMIGDRLNTDVLFGNYNKYQTLFVSGTGVHSMDDVQEHLDKIENGESDHDTENHIPDFHITSFKHLFDNA